MSYKKLSINKNYTKHLLNDCQNSGVDNIIPIVMLKDLFFFSPKDLQLNLERNSFLLYL